MFKVHRLVYHSTLGSRVIKKKQEKTPVAAWWERPDEAVFLQFINRVEDAVPGLGVPVYWGLRVDDSGFEV